MSATDNTPEGPDFGAGVALESLTPDSPVGGHLDGEPVVIVRQGDDVFAIGGSCTHYGGPLHKGIVVGNQVRCPWHHACFDLRTGEATCAPALNPVPVYDVTVTNGQVRLRKRGEPPDGATPLPGRQPAKSPARIVIVGGGAAGHAAAEMLRREGYAGSLTMLTADDAFPVDRPNLSKDYLAGTADPGWIPLRPDEFYPEHRIDVVRNARVTSIDTSAKRVQLGDNRALEYDRLLLATGADPVRLPLPGNDLPHVHYLRTVRDSEAIIAAAAAATRAVVMGASFIGLEVAASLRTRGLDVSVVAPESRPLERVLGPEFGDFIRGVHEEKGVGFHLGQTATAIHEHDVVLENGTRLAADLVAIGAGVRPAVALAESAGIRVEKGVIVNGFLETSVPDVFAAGDIARWPDARTGSRMRVEHWVVAQRQGQTAARNMLGHRVRYDAVPFFWSAHYDMSIRYVGHAEQWDEIRISGSFDEKSVAAFYVAGDRILAVATLGRDMVALEAEAAMERHDDAALQRLAARKD